MAKSYSIEYLSIAVGIGTMEESFSISALISQGIADFAAGLQPGLETLSDFGWSVGSWTLLMPIVLPMAYWTVLKMARTQAGGWRVVHFAAGGILLGGVIEHCQGAAHLWLTQGGL